MLSRRDRSLDATHPIDARRKPAPGAVSSAHRAYGGVQRRARPPERSTPDSARRGSPGATDVELANHTSAALIGEAASAGVAGAGSTLPHLDPIQRSFGRHDVSAVTAHSDSAARAACQEIGADAYATGTRVAFGYPPDLHTAAHEAAHVVQQRGGVHLSGGVGAAGDEYERHADAVADAVVAGRSAEALLDPRTSSSATTCAVQRQQSDASSDAPPAGQSAGAEPSAGLQTQTLADEIRAAFLARHASGDLVERIQTFYREGSDRRLLAMMETEYPRLRAEHGIVYNPSQFRQAAGRFRDSYADVLFRELAAQEDAAYVWMNIDDTRFEGGHYNRLRARAESQLYSQIDDEAAQFVGEDVGYRAHNVATIVRRMYLSQYRGATLRERLAGYYEYVDALGYDDLELFVLLDSVRTQMWEQHVGPVNEYPGLDESQLAIRVHDMFVGSFADVLYNQLAAAPAEGVAEWRTFMASDNAPAFGYDPLRARVETQLLTQFPDLEASYREDVRAQRDQRAMVRDLGQIAALDHDFNIVAGDLLEYLVPTIGDKKKLLLAVNFPVHKTPTSEVTLGLELDNEVERDASGLKMRTQLGGTVTGTLGNKAIGQAFARANVFGYMQAYGDSGAEVFGLLGYGIHSRLQQASPELAEAIFHPGELRATELGLDGDDYVETGAGFAISAGASGATCAPGDGDRQMGGSGGFTYRTGTRLSRNDTMSVEKLTLAGTFSAGPFELAGKFEATLHDGNGANVEVEASGQAMLDVDEITDLLHAGDFLLQMAAAMRDLAELGGAASDPTLLRKVSLLSSVAGDAATGFGPGVERATHDALENIRGFGGVKVGYKLTAKAAVDAHDRASFEVMLERLSTVEFGDNPRSAVYALIENTEQVFQLALP